MVSVGENSGMLCALINRIAVPLAPTQLHSHYNSYRNITTVNYSGKLSSHYFIVKYKIMILKIIIKSNSSCSNNNHNNTVFKYLK